MTAEEKAGKIIFDIKLEKGSDFRRRDITKMRKFVLLGSFCNKDLLPVKK